MNAQTYFSDDFNDGNLNGWTLTDSDGDSNNWSPSSITFPVGGPQSVMRSASWASGLGALTPNNWAVSPAVSLVGATGVTKLKWKVSAIDPDWDIEKYTVYVGTSSVIATLLTSTTTYAETTLNGVNELTERTLDVSAFNGQTIYVAFRHHGVTDQFTIEIDDVKVEKINPNDAELSSLSNINDAYGLNSSVIIGGVIKNNGSNTITSLDVNWSVDGGTPNVYALTGLNIASGATYSFTHPTPWSASPVGTRSLEVNVTNVNSTTDPLMTNNALTKSILVVNEVYAKSVVYEEGTGTWCGYCPRGHVGLKNMYHNHNDGSFIGIAVQNGTSNPMTLAAYDSAISAQISGYPSGLLNRGSEEVDPGQTTIEAAYQEEISKIAVGKIEITSNSWNSTTRQISLNVSAKFALDMAAANYNIAAIVVENGVTGTTSGYNQTNYYAGGSLGPLTDWEGVNWANLPNPVPAASMVYNHVGRALLGGFGGLSGIVPAAVTYNTPYSTTFTHTLPASQDENEIELVAIIIDNATGRIVNAVEVPLNTVLANENFQTDLGLKLYPNPSNGIVNVSTIVTSDLSISDVSGKTVFTKNQLLGENEINLSHLQSGIYFVKVKSGSSETTSKLILK